VVQPDRASPDAPVVRQVLISGDRPLRRCGHINLRSLRMLRTLVAGIAGGLALNLVMLLTFRAIGFGWDGDGILLTSSIQSHKLIAVWTTLEPLPLVAVNPAPIIVGLVLFGIGHAFIYRWISVAWPRGVMRRALRFAGLLFFMTYLFWEFFTPFNQFGEPLPLVALELSFWAAIAIAEAVVIAAIIEHGADRRSAA
jgi:hypothetical protein